MQTEAHAKKLQSVDEILNRAIPLQYVTWAKMDKAIAGWEAVVGSVLCKQSAPIDLINGELVVTAETPLAAGRLNMMRGNIIRALAERWGLEVAAVKVVTGRLPFKKPPRRNPVSPFITRPTAVPVSEEDVREFAARCAETTPDLPPEAAESIARLQAFFVRRFPDK